MSKPNKRDKVLKPKQKLISGISKARDLPCQNDMNASGFTKKRLFRSETISALKDKSQVKQILQPIMNSLNRQASSTFPFPYETRYRSY